MYSEDLNKRLSSELSGNVKVVSPNSLGAAFIIFFTFHYSCKLFFSFFPFCKWFQKAVTLWTYDPATRDATIVKEALSGNMVNFKPVIEIICSRTQPQIDQFRNIYSSLFSCSLAHDIEFIASGDHAKVLSLTPSFSNSFIHYKQGKNG